MRLPYAEIHFPLPLSRGYTYGVPEALDDLAVAGTRALVPLGKRVATGFLVRRVAEIDFDPKKLKYIFDVLDDEPLFDEPRMKLAEWIAEYYLASLGEVLRTMLPPGLEMETKQYVRLARQPDEAELAALATRAPRQAEIITALSGTEGYKVAYLARHLNYAGVRSSLRSLMKQGIVELSQKWSKSRAQPRTITFVQLTATGEQLLKNREAGTGDGAEVAGSEIAAESLAGGNRSTPERQAADAAGRRLSEKHWSGLELLRKLGAMSRAGFLHKSGLSRGALKTLVKKSLVELTKEEIDRNPYLEVAGEAPAITLNQEQVQAVEQVKAAMRDNRFAVFLLHGITGSGKTQVYIEVIRQALATGKGAIVLVPEISLTPQAVARFKGNFGEEVAVLHSRLSSGERYDAWRKVQRGEARVVVGARSAVFAPVRELGLIVVDEEHEHTYKQVSPSPRYHARDVAIMRAKMSDAIVVTGSATPAIESYYNARSGKFHLLELRNRIDNVPLPSVRLIDMMRFRKTAPDHEGIFSRLLCEKILEKLENQEQIILLQNRRGFAPIVRCVNCGFTRYCNDCNIPMTYHQRGHMLRCHYCNAYERAPDTCPQCHGIDLVFKGIGTQRVEAALRKLIPHARIVRMDFDTTRGKLAHDRILREFGEHKYDILLGTQMIAKGLDFHRVTLVGVISADTTLLRPDFRAGERTFQLLTQVAGRAGRRNLPGEVIIQTYAPDDFCLSCARAHDFDKFFASEIQHRQILKYPPYARLVLIVFRHKSNERARDTAMEFAGQLRAAKVPLTIHGPTPSLLPRIRNEFRWQLMIKSNLIADPAARVMRQTVARTLQTFHQSHPRLRVRIDVDIDPVTLT